MATAFANVPALLASQLETSTNQFKAFLQDLEHPCVRDSEQRTAKIQRYLREVDLWSHQFVYIHNIKTGQYYHKGIEEALGYDLDQLTPEFFVHNVHPADLTLYFEVSKALLSFVMEYSEALVPFESTCHVKYRMREQSGSYVSVLRKSTPFLKDEAGTVTAYISRCTDISHVNSNNSGPQVEWEVFGPKHEHFTEFAEELGDDRQGDTLFTDREMDVLRLLRDGLTSAEIADELYISVNTVNTHRKSLMRKAEVSSTVELLFFAQEHGYLSSS
jgi:DNA-binding CsgD family transcriptional regulator